MLCKKANLLILLLYLKLAMGQKDNTSAKKKSTWQIRYLDNCPNTNYPNRFIKTKVEIFGKGETAISGTIEIPQAIKYISKVKVTVTKCRSHSEPGTCEFFLTVPFGNGCQWLDQNNSPWSTIIDAIHPPLRCPMNKKLYELKNGTLVPSLFLKAFPSLEGYYYTANLEFIKGKATVLCASIGAGMATIITV